MRKKAQKRLMAGIITLLLAVMLAMFGGGFIGVSAQDAPQEVYSSEVDNGLYDKYTDSDEHENIKVNVFANYYKESVKLIPENIAIEGEAEKAIVRMNINKENKIALFVPKTLFAYQGVKTYIGKEYGFIVDTFAVEGSDALHSIVLLFDIKVEDDFKETKDHMRVSVSPVFQGEFAYVTPQTEKILCAYSFSGVKYMDRHTAPIYVSASSDTIVPVPSTNLDKVTEPEDCDFPQINKYYLKNFRSLVSLYNENHLNSFDDEYQVFEDKGAFFTQLDFTYSAHSYKEGKVSLGSVTNFAMKAVTTGIDVLRIAGALSPANPIVTLVDDMAGFIKSCFDMAGEAVDTLEITEKGATYTPYYTSAEE